MTTVTVTAANGIAFTARIIREGDRYGLDDCLTWEHADRPGVEFYDTRYPHTPLGQFVSRYYVETLLASTERHAAYGLDLHGGVADWKIDAAAFQVVLAWLRHETLEV